MAAKVPPQKKPLRSRSQIRRRPLLRLRLAKTKNPERRPQRLKPGGLCASYGTTESRALPPE